MKSLGRHWHNTLMRSREPDGLPVPRQLLEMAILYIRHGFGPGNYHKYRLWRDTLSFREKAEYWHDQTYYRFLDRVNPLHYRSVARNKVVAKALLRFFQIRDAEYLGYLYPDCRYLSPEGSLAEPQSLTRYLGSGRQKFCLKPVEGSGGEGFVALEGDTSNGLVVKPLASVVEAMPFTAYIQNLNHDTGYVVERYIEQHAVMARFNPSSVNTLRAWVGKLPSGEALILGMYLRVGRAGSLVDNRISGGFGVAIDLDDMKTLHGVPQDGGGGLFFRHPDSGESLEGVTIPHGEDIKAMCHAVIAVLPETRFVGLDIAVSGEGPVLIEFNLAPTPIGACVIGQSHRALLGVVEQGLGVAR